MRQRCRVRHLALSTEDAYVGWIRRYILFHHKRHPVEMAAPEVTAFLTHLAVDGHVAASTQNQALSALLFLYREVLEREFGWLDDVVRAKKPKRLPVVYTPDEAMAIIEALEGVRWLMGMLLYGGGLRLQECLRLRVKDLDFERLQVTVREGKGDKDLLARDEQARIGGEESGGHAGLKGLPGPPSAVEKLLSDFLAAGSVTSPAQRGRSDACLPAGGSGREGASPVGDFRCGATPQPSPGPESPPSPEGEVTGTGGAATRNISVISPQTRASSLSRA